MLWFTLGAIIVAIVVYLYLIKPLYYWQEKGIPYIKPWPIMGNMAPVLFRRKHFMDLVIDLYNTFPGRRYNGMFQFTKPTLLIRDLELIKRITVKDFDNFPDHNLFTATEDVDPLMAKNLSSLKGQRWREMRATLSPSFTGSKMRGMFVLLSECAEQFTQHFLKKTSEDVMEIEMKDVLSRFTNDAIATCAFGLECDSLEERDNEFYLMGKAATNFSGINTLKIVLANISPALMKLLKIKFFSDRVSNFFRRIVKDTMEMREKQGLIRPDMIHLLMEARKGRLHYEEHANSVETGFATVEESEVGKNAKYKTKEMTDDDITAQALIFFFGGFDTTSSMMCLASYALAVEPDVQRKLQAEIDETMEKCGGKLTYEAVMEMKYLDMVISETLRKWPLGFLMDRLCVNDYKIEPELPDEKPLTIKKGEVVIVPVIGIHRDPEYYPNPDKFDPERFSDENKHNIRPYTYFPFGAGPRNCIASRFALLESKILFSHLLHKFELTPVKKTSIPLVIDAASFNPMPKGGFWLGLQQRKNVRC